MNQQEGEKAAARKRGWGGRRQKGQEGLMALQGTLDPYTAAGGQQEGRAAEGASQGQLYTRQIVWSEMQEKKPLPRGLQGCLPLVPVRA